MVGSRRGSRRANARRAPRGRCGAHSRPSPDPRPPRGSRRAGRGRERRQVLAGRTLAERLCHEIFVRERDDRHAHAGQAADLRGEHAAGVDDDLRLDRTPLGLDAANPTAGNVDSGHAGVGEDRDAALARAGGERVGQLRGVEVAVRREIRAAAHAVGHHQREELLRLVRAEQLERQPEGLRPGDLTQHLLLALGRAGQADAAALDPAALERAVELDAVHHHLRQRNAAAQLPDEAGGVEGRAAGQLVAVEQDDVALPERRQVVGDRGAADATADDHDPRLLRKLARPRHPDPPRLKFAAAGARATIQLTCPKWPGTCTFLQR